MTTIFKVETNGIGSFNTLLVFRKYKAVMSPRYSSRNARGDRNYFVFSDILQNEEVVVVIIKNIGDEIFISTRKVKASNSKVFLNDFEEISEMDLRKKLSKLKSAF